MIKTELQPLSTADIETFERLVQQASDIRPAMNLHSLNGLCTALALCPHAVEPAAWLPWVWDLQSGLPEPEPAAAELAETVHALALRQQRWVAAAMAGVDRDAVPGLVAEALDADPLGYCQGFMVGVFLAFEHWVHLEEHQPEWLLPIRLLGQIDMSPAEALDDESLAALVDTVAPSLINIRQHWRGPQHPAADPLAAWVSVRQALTRFSKPFPHDAVVLAHAQRRVVAPKLVQLLEELARDPTPARDDDYMLHVFGIALLACWREPAAFRPLLALGRLDPAVLDDVFGDTLYDLYFRALASVCDGDLQPLQAMIEDEGVSIQVRSVLFQTWEVRVLEGDAPLAAFEAFLLDFGQRYADKLRQSGRTALGEELIDDVAAAACHVGAASLAEPLRGWIAEGLIVARSIDIESVDDEMARTWADRQQSMRRSGRGYVWDVADELLWWGGYGADREPASAPAPSMAEALPARPAAPAPKQPPQPLVRESPKIGRNDPCPCGSGRKYKKCHGAG